MASLPAPGILHLSRLTTAARLARMRPEAAVVVDAPGVLRTERLLLRPLTWADRAAYIDAVEASRAELDRFCPVHKHDETAEELFDRQLQLVRAGDATGLAWRRVAVKLDQGDRIVGSFNFNDISYGLESRAEMSFWVRTDEAGHGYAREAVAAMLVHAFAPRWAVHGTAKTQQAGLGLSRVDGLIAPDNHSCLHLVARLGFVPDAHKSAQRLTVCGQEVEHLPFVVFAPLSGRTSTAPRVPAGVSLSRSIESLMRIERIEPQPGT
jgi:ribosomal-protein-alanine N-acetyltransferase